MYLCILSDSLKLNVRSQTTSQIQRKKAVVMLTKLEYLFVDKSFIVNTINRFFATITIGKHD